MRKYEIMYILKADLDEAAREAEMNNVQALLEENGAKVKNVDTKLGMRELAYPINNLTKGFYVVLKVDADETALFQFNRKVKINPAVLRHLVVVDQQ
ncbi:MAG: 30S ribosomal protein S6 [Erysipelotrichaceae bacterium]|jgi:small subunit ribosomal protein S6|nr:30S ribosomal protein S6 [Erysipelotrichaceae bacterium]